MKVSDAIRSARAMKKMKQHELAAIIGVSQQMVSEWETDSEPVAEKNWQALDEALGIECATLEMPPPKKTTNLIQTTTGSRSPAQQNVGIGRIIMDESGITCAGFDDRNGPSGTVPDEWEELLYWLKRHPAMMRGVLEKARQIGAKMDEAANG